MIVMKFWSEIKESFVERVSKISEVLVCSRSGGGRGGHLRGNGCAKAGAEKYGSL